MLIARTTEDTAMPNSRDTKGLLRTEKVLYKTTVESLHDQPTTIPYAFLSRASSKSDLLLVLSLFAFSPSSAKEMCTAASTVMMREYQHCPPHTSVRSGMKVSFQASFHAHPTRKPTH